MNVWSDGNILYYYCGTSYNTVHNFQNSLSCTPNFGKFTLSRLYLNKASTISALWLLHPQEHLCPNAFASDFDTSWLLRWRLQMVHTPLALPLSGPEVACSPRQQIIYNPKPLLPWPSNLKVATLYPGTTDWGNTPGMDYTSRSLTV